MAGSLDNELLIENVTIIDPVGVYSGCFDVLIKNKKIFQISNNIKTTTKNILKGDGLYLCPGFVDLHCHLRAPGFTHKEDFESGGKAALAGGFTTICAQPNTSPVVDSVEIYKKVSALINKYDGPRILQLASLSIGENSEEPVAFKKLHENGVIAFSDDGRFLKNEAILIEALKFSAKTKVRIALHEEMTGIPTEDPRSEIEAIERDLKILETYGGYMHIMHISLKESCKLIEKAKKKKLNVTCEVTPHHLSLTRESVKAFGTNAKCNPPLRSSDDAQYLIGALQNGVIDAVATDHAPHTRDEKNRLYKDAPMGILGFQTAFSVLLQLVHSGKLTLTRVVEAMTLAPAAIYNIEKAGKIEIGESAHLVLFNKDKVYEFTEKHILSKSFNSPYLGTKFRGFVRATIHQGCIKYLSDGV